MKEWLQAESAHDVGEFYNPKYAADGYEAFSNRDRSDVIQILQKHGGEFSREKKLLDAGCGHGQLIEQIHESVKCFGIDVSRNAIRLAKERRTSAEFENIDMMAIPELLDGTMDYVTCLGAIEHTMSPAESFHRLMRLLKPGGIFLVTAPLQFQNCLFHIMMEPNKKTNERFLHWEEWVAMFGPQQPEEWFRVGDGDSKDMWMIYRKMAA